MEFDPKLDPVKIIRNGEIDRLISAAQATGRELAQGNLTTSQIRNVFGEVRTIEMNWANDPDGSFRRTILLQPKLAYTAAKETDKQKKGAVKDLSDILIACIKEIQRAPQDKRETYFGHFVDFFEAVLAYHRQAGGKNS